MASIPILAAVAAAIIVPVAGTGIYYSVKPAKQKEGEAIEEIARRLQNLATNIRERTMNEPRSGLLQVDKIAARGETAEQFEERSGQEKNEAIKNIDELLKNGGSLDLESNFPSAFSTTRTGDWASSHSSLPIRKP